jgi:hypothetical protein
LEGLSPRRVQPDHVARAGADLVHIGRNDCTVSRAVNEPTGRSLDPFSVTVAVVFVALRKPRPGPSSPGPTL